MLNITLPVDTALFNPKYLTLGAKFSAAVKSHDTPFHP
jgi:hypothetical protein